MRISKLVGSRTKEQPADAVLKSHALLMRAGFIKSVANGIWSFGMPAKRIATKIENIIREEMDSIDGQECSFPVVMPKELWDESGRYNSIGEELVRFTDRGNRFMVLGMTHEEAAVHFARDNVTSHHQLPFMIYQIQTKFRDEARSRGGLIRVREFTMKDAYSFHLTHEDLEEYYQKVYDAYVRIFKRVGLKNVVAVKSDSGMMGGKISHEFMFLSDAGEDKIVLCNSCGYKANMEVADAVVPVNLSVEPSKMQEIFTGDAKEIDEVAEALKITKDKTIKAVVYNIKGESYVVVCFIRGDYEVNEAKLKKVVRREVVPANLGSESEIKAGNIGPINLVLPKDSIVVYDRTLKGANGMVIGTNKAGYHTTGVSVERDIKVKEFVDIAKVKQGQHCSCCGAPLDVVAGVEVGNIFQLGTKYTQSMGMTVSNKDGVAVNPIMGCYGIGVGRALASIAEETSDEKGLNWPLQVAPWIVYLCPLRYDDPVIKEKSDELYSKLTSAGIETLYDDRESSPGVKFADCDLMGIPIRVVISQRLIASDSIEIRLRASGITQTVSNSECLERIKKLMVINDMS
ncbi:MAG: proline--tRNA ligase [Christensenellaceae bacterium]|jgi:prolyl-tRNA synthetase|nr:proline--tRNA ligase [Christensenellaceae bacterium]